MKKSFFTVFAAVFLLFGVNTANATPFSIDLDSIIPGLTNPLGSSTLEINNRMTINTVGTDYTTINQSFGADQILGNGDTFSEFGTLGAIALDGLPFGLSAGGTSYNMYFKFDGLAGEISNYNPGAGLPGATTTVGLGGLAGFGNVVDDTFTLDFYAGIGTIALYIDTDFDTGNGATEIATFSVLSGQGTSPEFVNGGLEGQFGLTLDFASYLPGVWSLPNAGQTFEEWEAIHPDSITLLTENLGATVESPLTPTGDGFTVEVSNAGFVSVSAVPEPTTMLLFGIGLLGIAGIGRKRNA